MSEEKNLDAVELDRRAAEQYLETLRWDHKQEMAMLKRLVAEKQARESLGTADAPLDKKPHE